MVETSLFASDLQSYDPSQIIQRPGVASMLPPIHIFHGTGDTLVPSRLSKRFASSLAEAGCTSVQYTAYEGYQHTEAMLERIMIGDNQFHLDLFACIQKWTKQGPSLQQSALGEAPKLCPRWMKAIGCSFKPC